MAPVAMRSEPLFRATADSQGGRLRNSVGRLFVLLIKSLIERTWATPLV
jgi:hypothetical protein